MGIFTLGLLHGSTNTQKWAPQLKPLVLLMVFFVHFNVNWSGGAHSVHSKLRSRQVLKTLPIFLKVSATKVDPMAVLLLFVLCLQDKKCARHYCSHTQKSPAHTTQALTVFCEWFCFVSIFAFYFYFEFLQFGSLGMKTQGKGQLLTQEWSEVKILP